MGPGAGDGAAASAQTPPPDSFNRRCQSNGDLSPIGRHEPKPNRGLSHHGLAGRPCGGPSLLVGFAVDEMALLSEMIVDGGMDRADLLQGLPAASAGHRPLAPTSVWRTGITAFSQIAFETGRSQIWSKSALESEVRIRRGAG